VATPALRPPILRCGRDADAEGFIALIAACWAEYPGCIMDMERENAELRALATYYADKGGALWAAEDDGVIVGMTAAAPLDGAAWEIGKVYVASAFRGAGLAQSLMAAAEAHAIAAGARDIKLWSDARFDRAHRFYEKLGYVRAGPIRVLNDLSNSLEYAYAKPGRGVAVRRLDAAGASSAERGLAEILRACVDAGASVSYLPPLAVDVARGFYHRAASAVAEGKKIMLGGWVDGVLAGTVMLDLDTPPNQPHRAEVQKLLVHPAARRNGLARVLMAELEAQARTAERSLLTLDTRAGDAAETLYLSLGYYEAGRIPRFALNADGTLCDTLLFWKELR
jgi:ribosomal protein S18 acetylase RimI-like enzyme